MEEIPRYDGGARRIREALAVLPFFVGTERVSIACIYNLAWHTVVWGTVRFRVVRFRRVINFFV